MESGVLEQRWCAEFTFEINSNRRREKKKIEGGAMKFCAMILYVLKKKTPGMYILFWQSGSQTGKVRLETLYY